MNQNENRNDGQGFDWAKVIWNIAAPLAMTGIVCFLGPKLLKFFLPFVIGWIIAMLANPLVRFLESRVKILRKHSSVIIVVIALAAVIGLLYFIISRLLIQAYQLAKDLPALYSMVVTELQGISVRFDSIFRRLPDSVQQNWMDFVGNVGLLASTLVQRLASPTVEAAGNVAKRIPNMLVNVIVTILSSYFFIAERDRIIEFWKRYLPEKWEQYLQLLRKDVRQLVGGYFLAQFKIIFVVGAILLAGFLTLGIKYSFLLAMLIALLDFLPLFGTGTVLIPWALIKLLSGNYALAAGLALLYVLTQVVRQLVQPKLVGDSMGLSPLYTLLFLYLGFKVQGISGMILAVPVGILVMRLYEHGVFDALIENIRILVQKIEEIRKRQD